MDEGARRADGKPAIRNALSVRKERGEEYLQGVAAISVGLGPYPAPGSGRYHHAERAFLRASSCRRSDDRPGSASADAARLGRPSDDFYHGGYQALSFGVAHSLPRMLRQSHLQKALRQDGIRPRRALELRGMDRCEAEARAAGSRPSAGG